MRFLMLPGTPLEGSDRGAPIPISLGLPPVVGAPIPVYPPPAALAALLILLVGLAFGGGMPPGPVGLALACGMLLDG